MFLVNHLQGFDGNFKRVSFDASFDPYGSDIGPIGLTFYPVGTIMYVYGTGRIVYQYALSTAFDIRTASYNSQFDATGTVGLTALAIGFSANGSKMYLSDGSGKKIWQFALSSGWGASSASYETFLTFNTQDPNDNASGIVFNADGTKVFFSMFVAAGNLGYVREFALSTPFDISTGVHTASHDCSAVTGIARGLAMTADGTKAFISSSTHGAVFEYALSTGFDVSTIAYTGRSYTPAQLSTVGNMRNIAINAATSRFYLADNLENIHQYTMPSGELEL